MRWFLCASLALICTASIWADTFVYVSMGPEKKIQIFRLDPADGKLTAVDTVPVKALLEQQRPIRKRSICLRRCAAPISSPASKSTRRPAS